MRTTYMIRRPTYVRHPVAHVPSFVDPWPRPSLFDEMDRMFDALWADLHRPVRRPAPVAPVSLDSDDRAVTVTIGLDGFSAEDIEVQLDGETLIVTGDTARSAAGTTDGQTEQDTAHAEATAEPETESDAAEGSTRATVVHPRRTFRRSWRLDAEQFQLDAIEARVEEDRLTVTLPRVARPEPRRITIQRA